MRLFQETFKKNLILFCLLTVVAISLAGKNLLSLPFFYEQTSQEKLTTFLIISIFFLVLTFFAARLFIKPYLSSIQNKNHLFMLIIMTSVITFLLVMNAPNYWAVPEIHEVEICFDATEDSDSLNIDKIVDPNTNRLFSTKSFGTSHYPITINSGQCVNGIITNLQSPLNQALMGYQLTVVVQESPPDGRFYLSINGDPAVVIFDQDKDEIPEREIVYKEGLDKGKKQDVPWRQYWFVALKGLGVFISALFISLFLIGFVEKMLAFNPKDSISPNGLANEQD